MTTCIFCSIVKGEVPADMVATAEECIAFKDLHPKAPVHILVVPRKHLASVAEMTDDDIVLMGRLMRCAQHVAESQGLAQRGYKLAINVGRGGGQVIDHVHVHLLGGWNDNTQSPVANV